MNVPDYALLYVDDPRKSAAFYGRLFGLQPVEAGPTFCLLVLGERLKLGLWKRADVIPPTAVRGGGGELAITVKDEARVNALHGEWASAGVPVVQPPKRLDFGVSFVVQDPDGHRLRVMALDTTGDAPAA